MQHSSRIGDPHDLPERPSGARSLVDAKGAERTIDIPPMEFRWTELLAALLVIGVPSGTWIFLTLARAEEHRFGAVVETYGPPLLLLAVLGSVIFWKHRSRSRIVLSTKGVTLEKTTPVGHSRATIPYGELEEVDIAVHIPVGTTGRSSHYVGPPHRSQVHVVARSRLRRLEFGHGLARSELEWLVALVRRSAAVHEEPDPEGTPDDRATP